MLPAGPASGALRLNFCRGSGVEVVSDPNWRSTPVSGDGSDPLEDFVRDRSEYLFQLALLLAGRNQADAQDLLQAALERAWRRRRAIARDGNTEAYVRRALVNASIDRWRWLRRRDERSLDAAGPGPAVGDPASLVARRDELIRALAALPPRQRA